MLWYKGWLETWFRLLFVLVVVAFMCIVRSYGNSGAEARAVIFTPCICVCILCLFLAGAGIATQPGLQAAKGLHGSTVYTLSLPVSRLRLLTVRAGIGWLEMAGGAGAVCFLVWFLFPAGRSGIRPEEMVEFAAVLAVCATALYCITVLLATSLDDQWRMWGSIICYAALWWLTSRLRVPASVNIFVAMSDGSPIIAHTMPWTAMAFALGLAAVLFFAALKVVEAREY